ncbi:complement C1q-like protein 3 [Mizuhopecten yessoensis]|uniref:complement C1q-like protein 3 n=1 Tax=Mizuhopecten yessoensis TaxID=6573 RepID=UPI000B45A40E|nr:complement C1q-like protein 3 [Mizuhopecten yessoensis]
MNAKIEDLRATMQLQLVSIRSENMDLTKKLQTLESKFQLHDQTSMSELDANNTAVESVKTATGTFLSNSGIARKRENRDYPHTRVGADVHEMIAFYACLSHDVSNPQRDTVIKFNHVITNLGGAYSPNTGVFRCPKAGLYVFTWSITSHLHGQVDTLIKKNGGAVGATLTASLDDKDSRVGSNSVILELAQGDEIDILVTYSSGSDSIRSLFSSFSGYLIDY